MVRVAFVGSGCLDVLLHVPEYPAEDADVRASDVRERRGGNAANAAAAVGAGAAWVGVVGDDAAGRAVLADLRARGVDVAGAVVVPGGVTPQSWITCSAATGSRTIVHRRELGELPSIVVSDSADWVHFEGRPNLEAIEEALRARAEAGHAAATSLELEKPARITAEWRARLLPYVGGLCVVSAAYVPALGSGRSAEAFAREELLPLMPAGAAVVVTLGREGAVGLSGESGVVRVPAPDVDVVVDSVGAGDAFIGGIVAAMAGGAGLEEGMEAGRERAGWLLAGGSGRP